MNACVVCKKIVDGYIPEYCCNDTECDCEGLPLDPCICSPECCAVILDRIVEILNRMEKPNDQN